MLFSLKVFMCRTLRRHSISVYIVFLLKFVIYITAQTQRDNNVMKFSGDFESFLRDLGSLVYKSKKHANNEKSSSYFDSLTTTPPQKKYRRSESVITQKAALGDVLMMKLVSYYEDKYKLVHHESTTTESITFMRPTTQPHTKKYNEVYGSDNRQTIIEINRRNDGRSIRRSYREPVPEVVIL